MGPFDRVTRYPGVMGGRACIRGMRVTVGMIVGQIGAGAYPSMTCSLTTPSSRVELGSFEGARGQASLVFSMWAACVSVVV